MTINISFDVPEGKFCGNDLANITCEMHGDKEDMPYCFAFQRYLDRWNPFYTSKCRQCLEVSKRFELPPVFRLHT